MKILLEFYDANQALKDNWNYLMVSKLLYKYAELI